MKTMKILIPLFFGLFLLAGCGDKSTSTPNTVQAETPIPKTAGDPGPENLADCFRTGGMPGSISDIRKVFNSDEITRLLASRNMTLEQWADALEKTEPKKPKEVWTAWYVFFHAGRNEAACKMYPLWRKFIEAMPHDTASDVYTRRQAIALLFEPFEPSDPRIGEPRKKPVEGRFAVWLTAAETLDVFFCLKYPAFRLKNEGWDNDNIFAWMKQRVQNALEYEDFPKPIPTTLASMSSVGYNSEAPVVLWQDAYLRYLRVIENDDFNRYRNEVRQYERNDKKGAEPPKPEKPLTEEIDRLNEDAKTHPGNWQKMIFFLQSLGVGVNVEDYPDMSWVAGTADKFTIPESLHLAHRFPPEIAEAFYRRALSEPLTPEEMERFYPKSKRNDREYSGGMGSPGGSMGGYQGLPYEITDEHVQAMFRVSALDQFIAFLRKQKRDMEIAVLHEERERLAKEYHIYLEGWKKTAPRYLFVSPGFDPEARPVATARKTLLPDDPKYWMELSYQHSRNKEPEKQKEALLSGLALYTEGKRLPSGSDFVDLYRSLVGFLKRSGNEEEIVELFNRHHALAKDQSESLRMIYVLTEDALPEPRKSELLLPLLRKDLKTRLARAEEEDAKLREKRKEQTVYTSTDEKELGAARSALRDLLSVQTRSDLAARIDPRDPLYWNIFEMTHSDELLRILLFPPDKPGNGKDEIGNARIEKTLDEESLRKAVEMTRKKPPQFSVETISLMLYRYGKFKEALPLLEKAFREISSREYAVHYARDIKKIQQARIECLLKERNWRQVEQIAFELFMCEHKEGKISKEVLADYWKKAAKLAGDKEAERIRKRLAELGLD